MNIRLLIYIIYLSWMIMLCIFHHNLFDDDETQWTWELIIHWIRINVTLNTNNQNAFEDFLASVCELTIHHNTLWMFHYVHMFSGSIQEVLLWLCLCVYTFAFFLRIGGTLHRTLTITGPGMWWSMTGYITMLTRTFSGWAARFSWNCGRNRDSFPESYT